MLSHASWRWGYGIHTILTPVLALPILITLWLGMRRGKKDTSGLSEDVIQEVVLKTRRRSLKEEAKLAFWQLDFIGLLLLVGGFGLFLVSITLANSKKTTWSSRKPSIAKQTARHRIMLTACALSTSSAIARDAHHRRWHHRYLHPLGAGAFDCFLLMLPDSR